MPKTNKPKSQVEKDMQGAKQSYRQQQTKPKTILKDGNGVKDGSGAGKGGQANSKTKHAQKIEPPSIKDGGPDEATDRGDLENKYLRLRAEFDNHVKRTQKEKSELIAYAGDQMIRKMLPILDDLHRTMGHAGNVPKDNPLVQGVGMIIEKFTKILEAEGVNKIESVGQVFDPELHEALMRRPSDDHPEGTIIEEFEPGYQYRDRVIRHAKVVVSG